MLRAESIAAALHSANENPRVMSNGNGPPRRASRPPTACRGRDFRHGRVARNSIAAINLGIVSPKIEFATERGVDDRIATAAPAVISVAT